MIIKNLKTLLPIIGLMVYGFILRIWGLNHNYAYWTDENHVTLFARAILERGKPVLLNGYSTGYYQILQYWITAISMKLFGISEFASRLPSVLFGTLTIGAIYLLGKEVFNKKVGYVSAILVTLLQIEILWSRQVRPYQALQLCYILSAWFIYRFVNKIGNTKRNIFGFFFVGVVATGLHGLGMVIIPVGLFYLLIFNWRKNIRLCFITGFIVLIFAILNHQILYNMVTSVGKINNLFYYRIFLTHNYLPLCLLGFIGGVGLIIKKAFRQLLLFAVFFLPQLIVTSFFLLQPFVRYFYIVLPFLFLLTSHGTVLFGESITYTVQKIFLFKTKNNKSRHSGIPQTAGQNTINHNYSITQLVFNIFTISIMTLSLCQSDKIILTPQQYYSLNNDMQEVPEVDWKKIYGFVGEKMANDKDIILVTNWSDQPLWYLGENIVDRFVLIRKSDRLSKPVDVFGEKAIFSIQEMESLKESHPRGLVIADSWDNYIPEGYQEYLKTNFKLLMEVDRLYPVQPRYWTVYIYGWGL